MAVKRKNKTIAPKIWWAVDPFQDNIHFHDHALKVLLPFIKGISANVTTVTYLDPYKTDLSEYKSIKFDGITKPEELLKLYAEQRLGKITNPKKNKFFSEPIFLKNTTDSVASLGNKISAINRHALNEKVEFIALHTHSRTGLKRFFMGSLAETFMLQAKVPLLLINPACATPREVKHILFPTDFSDDSKEALTKLLPMAAKLKARITILNYLHLPPLPIFLTDSASKVEFKRDAQKKEWNAYRSGEKLVKLAKKHKVNAGFELVSTTRHYDVSESVLKFAGRNQVDLIALASESSALKSTLIGATSREIVRASVIPVLIYRD